MKTSEERSVLVDKKANGKKVANEKLLDKLEKLAPSYSRAPLLGMLLALSFAYCVSKIIIEEREKFDLSIPLDDMIPFCAPLILFYVLAYVQWGVGYMIIAKQDKDVCYRMAGGNIIAKMLCFLIFIIVPTQMFSRPEVTGTSIFDYIIRLIYWIDTPVDLFPSIHCLESYTVMRFTLKRKEFPLYYKILNVVLSLLVFSSVVLTKQHIVVDIPAGILIFEIGYLISNLTGFYKVFDKFDKKSKVKEI